VDFRGMIRGSRNRTPIAMMAREKNATNGPMRRTERGNYRGKREKHGQRLSRRAVKRTCGLAVRDFCASAPPLLNLST